jgi:hypothetical protein
MLETMNLSASRCLMNSTGLLEPGMMNWSKESF